MQYLVYVALAYYALVGYKVFAQLYRVRFRLREFYNDKMSFHLGLFIGIHVVVTVFAMFVLAIGGMVSAVN